MQYQKAKHDVLTCILIKTYSYLAHSITATENPCKTKSPHFQSIFMYPYLYDQLHQNKVCLELTQNKAEAYKISLEILLTTKY